VEDLRERVDAPPAGMLLGSARLRRANCVAAALSGLH